MSPWTNLVTTIDTNNANDVFCRDRLLGSTELITISPAGTALDRATFNFSMSTNGRYFAFESASGNAASGITNSAGTSQVYWRDRQFGTSAPVALTVDGKFDDGGSSLRAMSADGRFVCFSAIGTNFVLNQNDQNHTLDLFIRDMEAGETWLVTRATNGAITAGRSTGGQFSANGEWLIFSAASADLVPGILDVNGGNFDVFAHHLPTRTNLLVSASHDGLSGADAFTSSDFARISSNGRFVLFSTTATNLIVGMTNHIQRLFLRDLHAGRTLDPLRVPIAPSPAFNAARFAITENERFIFFLTFADLDPLVPNTNHQLQLFRAPLFAPELHPAAEPGHLRGIGLAGASYISEATSNLVNWTAIATNLADAYGDLTIVDPDASSHSRRFYRLLSP
jgi:Tol biopolymer transport system component